MAEKLVLYGVAVSAFVAKVRIVLDYKAMPYEEVAPPDGYGSEAYRKVVPAGSVPGLLAGETALHDSNAIIEYLEDTCPVPPLRPADPVLTARMRGLLGFHDTRLEAAARMLFPAIKGTGDPAPGLAATSAALDRLDEIITAMMPEQSGGALSVGPFLFGEAPSLADLAYPCTIQMADMMARELGAPLAVPPAVARWRDAAADLPAVARSLAIAGDAMGAWMAGFRR